jgi:cyclophilin family peptidyl-prolyl cis-trans isomerase
MKTAAPFVFRTVLLGSILALNQPVFSVGEPEFAARPIVSSLEADNPDVPATVHCGKTLVIPIVVSDPEGQPLSYTVKTNKPWLLARVRTGHPVMKMRVRSANDGTGAPLDGTMEFALFRAETRDTAEFIAGFAQAPYYENVLFHRVIDEFVLQGGDPAGTGSGPSPYVLPHEFKSHLVYSGRGQLAMANSSGGYSQSFPSYGRSFQATNSFGFPDGTIEYATARTTPTNGSQFFITLGQPRHLDFKHTLFGQLLRGFDIMDKVAKVPVNGSSKPNVNVTMSELSVRPSSSDAILYLSATNVGAATVTVTAEDVTGKKTSKTYAITSVKDTINDPPFLAPLAPQVVPLGRTPSVDSHAEDLESDRILTRVPVRVTRTFTTGAPTTTNTVYAGFTAGILDIIARPTIGAWDVTVGVSGANDPAVGASDFDASRFQLLEVGVGDKVIGVEPVTLEAKEAVATPSSTIASFRYGGIVSSPSDFIASVNWGDGSALQASNGASPQVTIVPSISKPGYWDVKAAHTYVRAGTYPLHVTIDGPLGSTQTAKGYAVVAAETALFSAIGEHHTVIGATFANRPIAMISDATAGVDVSDYDVVVDWGDGTRTTENASIRHVGVGRYAVFASHRYTDPERYSVMVTVTRAGFSSTAWSSLEVKGFTAPRYLPPFPKANLGSQWSESVRLGNQDVSGLPTKKISGARTDTSQFSIAVKRPCVHPSCVSIYRTTRRFKRAETGPILCSA